MRPLLLGTDSTEQLRLVCEALARAAGTTREEKTRLCYPDICISSLAQKREISRAVARRKFSDPFKALGIILLIVLGTVVILTSYEASLRAAAWQPGHWYNLNLPDGRPMLILFKGTLPTKEDLPHEGNQIGDFWAIDADPHIWVWTVPIGGSIATGFPTWIDP